MADAHYEYTIERAESGRRICGVIRWMGRGKK